MACKTPISVRRVPHREYVAANPQDWHKAYNWLRAEMRDLDYRCETIPLLGVLVRRARHRMAGDAVAVLLAGAGRLDSELPLDEAEALRRAKLKAEFDRAASDDNRMYRACAWLRSSAKASGGVALACAETRATRDLARITEKFGAFADRRTRWLAWKR